MGPLGLDWNTWDGILEKFLFQKADPNHILILMHMCVNRSIFLRFFSFRVCIWFRLWFRKFCNKPCASSGRTSLSLVSHMTVIFLVFRSCLCHVLTIYLSVQYKSCDLMHSLSLVVHHLCIYIHIYIYKKGPESELAYTMISVKIATLYFTGHK